MGMEMLMGRRRMIKAGFGGGEGLTWDLGEGFDLYSPSSFCLILY